MTNLRKRFYEEFGANSNWDFKHGTSLVSMFKDNMVGQKLLRAESTSDGFDIFEFETFVAIYDTITRYWIGAKKE